MIKEEEYPPFLFDPEKVDMSTWNWDDPSSWPWSDSKFEGLHDSQSLKFIFQGIPEDRLRKVFVSGLEHGNSSVGYMILNIVSLREHNRICEVLKAANPSWDDERLFQTARNTMIVLLLNVVLGDYINHITPLKFPFFVQTGVAEKESWYRTNWITLEFNLLYRWHSMVPEHIEVSEKKYKFSDYRSNPNMVFDHGLGPLITSSSRQLAGRIGLKNTHEFFFQSFPIDTGKPEPDRRSIQDRTVEMARAFKLQPMNCLLYTSPSPRDLSTSRMPSSA